MTTVRKHAVRYNWKLRSGEQFFFSTNYCGYLEQMHPTLWKGLLLLSFHLWIVAICPSGRGSAYSAFQLTVGTLRVANKRVENEKTHYFIIFLLVGEFFCTTILRLPL